MLGEAYRRNLEDYFRKFKDPAKFVEKILSSIPIEVDFIDAASMEFKLSNRQPPLEIEQSQKEAIKKVLESRQGFEINLENKKILFSPVFNAQGDVVEVIRFVVENEEDLRIKELEKEIKSLRDELNKKENLYFKEFDKSIDENFKRRLNENEREVLYALARYPEKSEAEISKMLKIKRSTISSVKSRLKSKGFFRIISLPNPNVLDIEVLSFFYSELKKPISLQEINLKLPPEVVFLAQSQNYIYGIFAGKRYSLFEKFSIEFSESLKECMKSELRKITYLSNVSEIQIKDFRQFLKKTNGQTNTLHETLFKKTEKIPENDKKLFFEFIKHPDTSVNELSKLVWFSRPTLLNKKKKFLKEGKIVPLLLLNVVKMGFKKMMIVTINDIEDSPLLKRMSFVFLKNHHQQFYILFLKNNTECDSVLSKAREKHNLESEIISLDNFRILKHFDLSQLIEKYFFSLSSS